MKVMVMVMVMVMEVRPNRLQHAHQNLEASRFYTPRSHHCMLAIASTDPHFPSSESRGIAF